MALHQVIYFANWIPIFLWSIGFVIVAHCTRIILIDISKQKHYLNEAKTKMSEKHEKEEAKTKMSKKPEKVEAQTKCDCDLREELLNRQRLCTETEYREKCFEWEKVKQNLISKLDAATESLQRYESIQKDYVEDRLKWDVEKKNLCIEIESSEQLLQEYKDKCLNLGLKLDAATQSLESYQAIEENRLKENEDCTGELDAAKQSLPSISDKLECVKWRVEKMDISTKLCTEIESSQTLEHLLQEYEDKCLVLEKEKQNLISKLDAATDSLEYYRGIEKKNVCEELAAAVESLKINSVELEDVFASLEFNKTRYENLRRECFKCEFEIKDLCTLLCTEIESSQSLKQLLQESEDKCLNLGLKLDAATDYLEFYQATVKDQLEKNEDLSAELNITKASLMIKSDKLESVSAFLQDYQTRYEEVVKDFGERIKLDVERIGLSAKIFESNSLVEHYKSSICDLIEERNNLSSKVSELESAADHYRKLVNECDEKFRRFEEEKNDLVSEVNAAKEACQFYGSYFPDFTFIPK